MICPPESTDEFNIVTSKFQLSTCYIQKVIQEVIIKNFKVVHSFILSFDISVGLVTVVRFIFGPCITNRTKSEKIFISRGTYSYSQIITHHQMIPTSHVTLYKPVTLLLFTWFKKKG